MSSFISLGCFPATF